MEWLRLSDLVCVWVLYWHSLIRSVHLQESSLSHRATLSGKGCHKECWEEYTQIVCERCLHCNDPILPVEGRFGGEYIMRDNGQVSFLCFVYYGQ